MGGSRLRDEGTGEHPSEGGSCDPRGKRWKSKHEGREGKATGVPDKVEDKIGDVGFAHSGREGGEKKYIYLYKREFAWSD